METLEELSQSKLHAPEQETVREAADALFFCDDLSSDPAGEEALAAFYELMDRLIESDRVVPDTAGRLTAHVEACGPLAAVR